MYLQVEFPIGLDGSDFVVCTTYTDVAFPPFPPGNISEIYEITLLNVFTGEIVSKLPVLLDSADDPFEASPKAMILLEPNKYLVICGWIYTGTTDIAGRSLMAAVVVNILSGAMEWIIHPYIAPVANQSTGTWGGGAYSVAFGPIVSGSVIIYWTENYNGYDNYINTATISSTGFTSGLFYRSPDIDIAGVAYDLINDIVVAYMADGSFRKISLAGTVIETIPGSNPDFNINVGVENYQALFTNPKPGYVVSSEWTIYGNIYEINLDTCHAELVLDWSTLTDYDVGKYYDQYQRIATEGSEYDGQIYRISILEPMT